MALISMLSTNQLVATTPIPALNENRYFFIIKSPFITKSFLKPCAREGEHPPFCQTRSPPHGQSGVPARDQDGLQANRLMASCIV
jgi:hypothetical protein